MFLASHFSLPWLDHSITSNHNHGISITIRHVHHMTSRFNVFRFVRVFYVLVLPVSPRRLEACRRPTAPTTNVKE